MTIGDSPCKIELDTSKVKTSNQMEIKKEILADSLFPPSEKLCFPESADLPHIESGGEDVEMIEYRGYKKYSNPLIFQNTPVQVVEGIPDDIDDICIYEVPHKADLSNCKGKRSWCKVQSTKSSTFSKGFKLIMNCRGSYICANKNCPNIPDIGVNRSDFMMENDIPFCCICNHVAEILKCEARLIIGKDLERMKNMVSHFGIHTFLIRVKGKA